MLANSYLHRKLHSLLGVVPLGAFIAEHVLTNYSAVKGGKEAFLEHVNWIHSLPFTIALEAILIWIPLLYHGVYGLYVAYQSRNNVSTFGYFRNWMFMLQRVTGVITFVWLSWHIFGSRVQVALGTVTQEEVGSTIHAIATNPLYFWLYAIGITCAMFHFSNGLWSFLVSWGITVGPRAQRVATYLTMGLFVILTAMFLMALNAFKDEQFALNAAASLPGILM